MFSLLFALTTALPQRQSNPPPEGWTDLTGHPSLRFDLKYATPDNVAGVSLPGYGAPAAWLLDAPAQALFAVQADLEADGLGLLVLDAYRPQRASQALVAWAYRSGQGRLVSGGYIRPDSFHNRGMAIDLTLVRLGDGQVVHMGTAYDDLSVASHTTNATGAVLEDRLRLKKAMEGHGWKNYWREWWHYSWPAAGSPPLRDVPYGCFEEPEGAWVAPAGWDRPGWRLPDTWATGPCPS